MQQYFIKNKIITYHTTINKIITYQKKIILIFCLILFSCKKNAVETPLDTASDFVSALDISNYPEIATYNQNFYDKNGNKNDFIAIIKESGINTIRLRLWVNPSDGHSGFEEVKQFAQSLKTKGFKIWLTLHYSDTWADPSQQITPIAWQGLPFNAIKENVEIYTKKVVTEINPDFIQIGNEINVGFLHPYGHITQNYANFITLMTNAIKMVRTNSTKAKIIIHFAGINASDWFFEKVKDLDYDIIGLSYYPIWHEKSLINLKNKLVFLGNTYNKNVIIAETSYPFTLNWNDWTNNVVGFNEQLILPDYPSTPEGQRNFLKNMLTMSKETPKCIGLCYWGGELIAWKGNQSSEGSSWENQALFDFQNKALPALEEFKKN